MILFKILYYILNFTWGGLMSVPGAIAALVMTLTGRAPQKWGGAYYFEVGKGWGGFSLGPVFFIQYDSNDHLKNHEFGHSFQNMVLGPFAILLCYIPSVIRYWYREYLKKQGKPLTDYDSVWFEGSATKLGTYFHDKWN